MSRRLLAGITAAVALPLLWSPVVPAEAALSSVSSCTGVWVVVDSGIADPVVRCATSYSTGAKALSSAGFKPTITSGGMVTRISSFPAKAAVNTSVAYWSYWHASVNPDGTWGEWTYSAKGAKSFKPVKGSAEGWRYQELSAGNLAPTVTPPAGYASSPAPVITGRAKVGQRLTATLPTWSPEPQKVTFTWYRSGKKIKGATASTYQLTKSDKAKKVTVKVTASGTGLQTVSRTSSSTAKVAK